MTRGPFVLTALIALSFANIACASPTSPEPTVTDPPATPVSAATTELASAVTVALTLRNDGQEDDLLLGATTPVADYVEVHRTQLVNGRREMVVLPNGLIIPAETTLLLEPGSTHLMLIDLRQDLIQGRTFPLTLIFRRAGVVTVTARVRRKLDAAGITPFPPVVAGDLSISLVSAPPAPALSLARTSGS
jgi:copper(I)-binding protein